MEQANTKTPAGPMTTDLRALCARMADELDHYRQLLSDDRRELHPLGVEARAALAEPQPKPPTVMEIIELADEIEAAGLGEVDLVRAALARWGNYPGSPDSSPQPIPVSELPGADDCDEEGRCWLLTVEDGYPQWRLHSIQGAQPGGAMIWVPVDSSPGVMVNCFYTSHWLPAHALPLPNGEVDK